MTAVHDKVNSPKVLALVSDAFGGHGGIALYMRDVLRCLATMNGEPRVTVIARAGNPHGVVVPNNIRWDERALKSKSAFAIATVIESLALEKPDLVVCGHINLLPLARLASLRSNVPMVLFIYGIDAWNPPNSLLARKLARSTNLTISISEITRQRFLAWSGASPSRVKLVPNAIKLERYGSGPKNPELIARYGIEGKRVLMTLCRLSAAQRHKGVDEIIEIMPTLLGEFPDLVYLVAGGGDDIERLQQSAANLGVGDRVIFTGLIDEAEKAEHYRLADAFALTGRGDGFGFVLLEAMACGIPVAASMLDGSREAILNGELGVLVNPDERRSLIEGLTKVLKQPKGVPPGLEHFAYDKFCDRLQGNLATLMKTAE